MRFPVQHPRSLFRRATARDDALSGLVLGVESVPDGLASGLLAGVNPVAGLYAYLFGMAGGALFTSTGLMAIQGTGAMAMIVSDVDLSSRDDPLRALYTLAMLTGIVMIVAGLLRLGTFLRFVSKSVMTGFTTAVGVNIVLGQLDNFTGYAADGGNRLARLVDLAFHLWEIDVATVAVGVVTIVLIVTLQRTSLGALGLVIAVFFGSALAGVLAAADRDVALVADVATVPRSLPGPVLPAVTDIPFLLVPAVSLAFVGLVQGAAVSSNFPNPDGSPQDGSQDFVAQGAGNIVAGSRARRSRLGVGDLVARNRRGKVAAGGVLRRGGDGGRGRGVRGRDRAGGDALAGRAPDRCGDRDDQAGAHPVGGDDGPGVADRDADHVRAHAAHPAAVRRPRRRRHLGHPVRDPAVEPPVDQAGGVPRRRPRRRGRAARRGAGRRGDRAPAVRCAVLRHRVEARRAAADRDPGLPSGSPAS